VRAAVLLRVFPGLVHPLPRGLGPLFGRLRALRIACVLSVLSGSGTGRGLVPAFSGFLHPLPGHDLVLHLLARLLALGGALLEKGGLLRLLGLVARGAAAGSLIELRTITGVDGPGLPGALVADAGRQGAALCPVLDRDRLAGRIAPPARAAGQIDLFQEAGDQPVLPALEASALGGLALPQASLSGW
jgi:hypothetical protein